MCWGGDSLAFRDDCFDHIVSNSHHVLHVVGYYLSHKSLVSYS